MSHTCILQPKLWLRISNTMGYNPRQKIVTPKHLRASPASMLIAQKLWGFLEKRRSLCIIRDFKIHYGGLLLRLLRPWGTKLATPFPPQTFNTLRFRCTATGCSVSTCLNKNGYVQLYPTFIRQRLDNDFLLLCRSYISQNLDLPLSGF